MRYRLGLRFMPPKAAALESDSDSASKDWAARQLPEMVKQALASRVMSFDTCAAGREALLPSLLLAALVQATGGGSSEAPDLGSLLQDEAQALAAATDAHVKLHDILRDSGTD